MPVLTLEERVAVLEAEVEALKQQREADQPEESVPWWERFVGLFENNPGFEEAVRYGQRWRASKDNNLADAGLVVEDWSA